MQPTLALHNGLFENTGGMVKEILLKKDWSTSDVGPIQQWSTNLLSAVSMIVSNPFPLMLYWGPRYSVFYNNACALMLGSKHPNAFGAPAKEVWSEAWFVVVFASFF